MRMDHATQVESNDNGLWVAFCSCRRWRSKPYKDWSDADAAGDAHVVRGDEHLRAIAGLRHGRTTLRAELRWYEEQANDPMNSQKEREMWQLLADDLRPRAIGADNEGQLELF